MKLLAFDTATRATTVALDLGEGRIVEARDDPPPGLRPNHTTRLMALIVELLAQTGTSWEELERIAVGVGPGTFTGLRIGVATARALGRARNIPLVGVSTLEALAINGEHEDGREGVLAVLDARRGEVFAAAWSTAGDRREPLLSSRAIAPQDLADLIPRISPRTLAIGEGAVEFRTVLERSGVRIPDDRSEIHRVTAACHCRLARSLPLSDPDEIRPEYLRLPDAELARRAAKP